MDSTPQQDRHASDPTRNRILEAAGKVFADRGFEHATVREIVDLAGTNIASVNYHFGGKKELYSEVLKKLMAERQQAHPIDAGLTSRPTPKEKLSAFVRGYIGRMLLHETDSVLSRLMSREMIQPTHVLDELVRDVMTPNKRYLASLVEEVVGRKLGDEEQFFAISSVISQIMFHKHCRPVIERIFPGQGSSAEQIERLAEHITDFAYAGLQQMAGPKKRPRHRPLPYPQRGGRP